MSTPPRRWRPGRPAQDDGYTDEERQDGYKLYGIVLLVGMFSLTVPLGLVLIAGGSILTAMIIAVMFSLVLTFNVKRILERQYREKYPHLGRQSPGPWKG